MLTVELAVMRASAVVFIATLAASVAFGFLRGWHFVIDAAMALGLVVAVSLGAAYALAWRQPTTREGADFHIVIADGHLRMSVPGQLGTQVVDVDLASVRHIHWHLSDIDRKGTVRITLWDRPSTFTMQATDVHPDDPDARKLGWFRGHDLLLQREQHRRFVEHFEPLVLNGQVTSTVELETLQPTRSNADHTAPGWVAFEDKLIYSPHLAETERRMRSE